MYSGYVTLAYLFAHAVKQAKEVPWPPVLMMPPAAGLARRFFMA
ncbi:hypothetical protein [Halomonas eurihalina]|nr:hypothetical protein [Halomonas eurihalina]MDR5858160.1 hypothetical protein [Halomonas eurihalina]